MAEPRQITDMTARSALRRGPRLRAVTASGAARPRLAEILLDQGAITQDDMLTALALQRHQDLPLGEILMAHGVISEVQLLRHPRLPRILPVPA